MNYTAKVLTVLALVAAEWDRASGDLSISISNTKGPKQLRSRAHAERSGDTSSTPELGPLAEYDPVEEDPFQTIVRNDALGQASSSVSELVPTHDFDNGGSGSESAFTNIGRLRGEHQTATQTLGRNLEFTGNKGRQRQHNIFEDEAHIQVVEEGLNLQPEITHERAREHAEHASSGDSDYTRTQAGHVPVTLETENARHREHKDPADKLHPQVNDEGVKPLPEIKHELVREHYVWGSSEQVASDESDNTGTQAWPVPTSMGSTSEVVDYIDEDLFQVVSRQRKHAEGSDSVRLDSSSSTDGKLLEPGIGKLDTDFDAATSNLFNRHRGHTNTLTATDSTTPGLQMGLDDGDVLSAPTTTCTTERATELGCDAIVSPATHGGGHPDYIGLDGSSVDYSGQTLCIPAGEYSGLA
ncbi:hypothetical protein THAOC_08160, partial [Thalassiosira oceanica]